MTPFLLILISTDQQYLRLKFPLQSINFYTGSTNVPVVANTTIPDPGIPDNSVMVWGIEGTGSNDAIVTKTFGNTGNQQYWVF